MDSGAHMATDSLHRIEWPIDGKLPPSLKIVDVVSITNSNFWQPLFALACIHLEQDSLYELTF